MDEPSGSSTQVELPPHLILGTYAAARAKEVQIMRKELSVMHTTKMQFQKLPKHMRRRAMSHNAKRLPRRLREIHLSQMKKSGLPPKQKRPSRKYRRKPKNLMREYNRRKSKVKWLDTHIWHAKRFHMIEKWGYKLPFAPCDKAFRACYRATSKHCLIQDISYVRCVEIAGKYEQIVECFKKVTDNQTGLTIGAKCYAEGKREGNVTLFNVNKGDSNIRKAIGNVSFLWKPIFESERDNLENIRMLWIWIHPSFYNEALESIITCLNLQAMVVDLDTTYHLEVYSNSEGTELKEITSELCRFRLTGPLSQCVLSESFKLLSDNFPTWATDYKNIVLSQNKYFESIFSVTQLSPNLVLPLIVRDPRFSLPKIRTKALPNVEKYSQCLGTLLDTNSMWSPIWNAEVRKSIKKNKISNEQICKIRSEMLVPGEDIGRSDSVAILLIQRPGNREASLGGIGYGAGWDIILPSSFAQPFFVSLIMHGARAGGLRETQSISFEMGQSDILFPDTDAGKVEEEHISKECRDKFFRLPPNKRTNYNKFRIASPFSWNWKQINKDFGGTDNFYVLRNKKLLKEIQEALHSKNTPTNIVFPQNCFIPISIKLAKKGLCKKFSIICLPQMSDFKKEPVEINCKDSLENERKQMRKDHKALLKRLRKKRINARRNGKVIPIDKEMLSNYTKKMRSLWLPEATNIRNSCSREVIGFVKYGDFSFQLGQGKAVGYITSHCLKTLLSCKYKNKVLVRNTNSRQYRLGTLDVICI